MVNKMVKACVPQGSSQPSKASPRVGMFRVRMKNRSMGEAFPSTGDAIGQAEETQLVDCS